jgi:hypothetical protein
VTPPKRKLEIRVDRTGRLEIILAGKIAVTLKWIQHMHSNIRVLVLALADILLVALLSSVLFAAEDNESKTVALLTGCQLAVGAIITWAVVTLRKCLWLRIASALLLVAYCALLLFGLIHVAISSD